jgi:hypothetical protein
MRRREPYVFLGDAILVRGVVAVFMVRCDRCDRLFVVIGSVEKQADCALDLLVSLRCVSLFIGYSWQNYPKQISAHHASV